MQPTPAKRQIGPSWRRRWSILGRDYARCQMLNKPVPKLFERLHDVMSDKRMEHAQAVGARKRRPRKEEGKVLQKIRIREIFARAKAARAANPVEVGPDLAREMMDSLAVRAFVSNREKAVQLYAALCNVEWQKGDAPCWGCSWRSAGGIVARLRNQGEYYLDFYCSGNEGVVSADVHDLLSGLGWRPLDE